MIVCFERGTDYVTASYRNESTGDVVVLSHRRYQEPVIRSIQMYTAVDAVLYNNKGRYMHAVKLPTTSFVAAARHVFGVSDDVQVRHDV